MTCLGLIHPAFKQGSRNAVNRARIWAKPRGLGSHEMLSTAEHKWDRNRRQKKRIGKRNNIILFICPRPTETPSMSPTQVTLQIGSSPSTPKRKIWACLPNDCLLPQGSRMLIRGEKDGHWRKTHARNKMVQHTPKNITWQGTRLLHEMKINWHTR